MIRGGERGVRGGGGLTHVRVAAVLLTLLLGTLEACPFVLTALLLLLLLIVLFVCGGVQVLYAHTYTQTCI